MIFLARLLLAAHWVRREGKTSRELDLPWLDEGLRRARRSLGLRRPVLLTVSDRVRTPVAAALPWPLVILPATLVERKDRDLIEHALYSDASGPLSIEGLFNKLMNRCLHLILRQFASPFL